MNFYWRNKNKIYTLLLNGIGCGPFDGGCVVFAEALKKVYGGEVMVLVNGRGAQHAVLLHNGRLIDADGPLEQKAFIKRYEKNERVNITECRKMGSEDLQRTPRDDALSSKIAKLLKRR